MILDPTRFERYSSEKTEGYVIPLINRTAPDPSVPTPTSPTISERQAARAPLHERLRRIYRLHSRSEVFRTAWTAVFSLVGGSIILTLVDGDWLQWVPVIPAIPAVLFMASKLDFTNDDLA
jgi:hypothetical protein